MATQRTLDKLQDLVGEELDTKDARFIVRNWDDAPAKLQRQVVGWVRDQDVIPAALQTLLIDSDERMTKAISDVALAAQEMIFDDKAFVEDRETLVAKAAHLSHICEALWKLLTRRLKAGDLKKATIKALVARKDCPEAFVKASGLDADDEVRKVRTKKKRTGAKEAKSPRRAKDEADDDFALEDDEDDKPTPKKAKAKKVDKKSGKKAKKSAKVDDFVDAKRVGHAAKRVRRPNV